MGVAVAIRPSQRPELNSTGLCLTAAGMMLPSLVDSEVDHGVLWLSWGGHIQSRVAKVSGNI